MGASLGWHLHSQTANPGWAQAILLALVVSQAVLWSLPSKMFEGMRMIIAIFLMDLNLVLCGLWATGLMQADLVMVLFLGIFMPCFKQFQLLF